MAKHVHTELVDCPVCWPERFPIHEAIETRLREIRKRFQELIPKATLTCPFRQHVHDHKCYHSYSLSYWTGQYEALRELQWDFFSETSVEDERSRYE